MKMVVVTLKEIAENGYRLDAKYYIKKRAAMEFKEKVVNYLKEHGVTVNRVEQEGDTRSIVCHVPQSDNIKIANMKDVMEKVLDVVAIQSDSFGMNVVVIEDNNLEDEDES